MNHRPLGNTGLRVSELSLGTMSFGGSGQPWKSFGALDDANAEAQVRRALDAGVDLFDTADAYADGESERMLGRALGERRKDALIATKVGFPTGPEPADRGLGRAHVRKAADASLRRLRTDWIDVYFAHRRDPATPVAETMQALGELVQAGKVRYLGVSNWPAWQIVQANAFAAANGLPRFAVAQMNYNLVARDIERELVPMLRDQQMGLMVWSPLAGGVLTGKYDEKGEGPLDARRSSFELGPLDWHRVNRVLTVARAISAQRLRPLATIALAWLLAQPHVTSVVLGAKKMVQLNANLAAAGSALEAVDVERLSKASALPPEYPGWYLEQFDRL
jgi:aryl-alcohol dehydrogenase-like predicted oxidoreductase